MLPTMEILKTKAFNNRVSEEATHSVEFTEIYSDIFFDEKIRESNVSTK